MPGHSFITRSFNPQPHGPCFCGSDRPFRECCGSEARDRPPPRGVHVHRRYLDPAQCAEWVGVLERQPGQPTGTLSGDAVRVNQARVTERVFLGPVEEAVTGLMRRVFTTTIPEATGTPLAWFERPQILRYAPGGHYRLHADSERYLKGQGCWEKTIDRDVSLLLYLNDDFEGGELEFFAFHYFYRPRAGDLVFFPSDHRYAHRALEVTGGTRYVVVSWAAQAGVPRVGDGPTANSIVLEGD